MEQFHGPCKSCGLYITSRGSWNGSRTREKEKHNAGSCHNGWRMPKKKGERGNVSSTLQHLHQRTGNEISSFGSFGPRSAGRSWWKLQISQDPIAPIVAVVCPRFCETEDPFRKIRKASWRTGERPSVPHRFEGNSGTFTTNNIRPPLTFWSEGRFPFLGRGARAP